MKTLTLEQAIAQATKGPLHCAATGDGHIVTDDTGICIAVCWNRGTETPHPDINAALLAHSYNHIGPLVEALKYARRFLNSKDHDTAYVSEALQKAQTLQLD